MKLGGIFKNIPEHVIELAFDVSISDTKYVFVNTDYADEDLKSFSEVEGSRTSVYHRIRAIKDFGDVKSGDLGGWVSEDAILDQSGKSWVYTDSYLGPYSILRDDSTLSGSSKVIRSTIYGKSKVVDSKINCSSLADARIEKSDITACIAWKNTNISIINSKIFNTEFHNRYSTAKIQNIEVHTPKRFHDKVCISDKSEYVSIMMDGRSYYIYPILIESGLQLIAADDAGNLYTEYPAVVESFKRIILANLRETQGSTCTGYFET